MKTINLGNTILIRDKIIGIRVEEKSIRVLTIAGETVLLYDSDKEAQYNFEHIYNQLNAD